MKAYFRFVLRHRAAVTIGCLLLTGLAGWVTSRAVLASSIRKMFFGDHPRYAAYVQRVRRFANDEVFVIAYEDPTPLAGACLARLERAVARVERMPDVARTDSLLNAQRIWSAGDTLHVERYSKLARSRPQDAPRLLAELRNLQLLFPISALVLLLVVLVVALLADLLLVPAMTQVGLLSFDLRERG